MTAFKVHASVFILAITSARHVHVCDFDIGAANVNNVTVLSVINLKFYVIYSHTCEADYYTILT